MKLSKNDTKRTRIQAVSLLLTAVMLFLASSPKAHAAQANKKRVVLDLQKDDSEEQGRFLNPNEVITIVSYSPETCTFQIISETPFNPDELIVVTTKQLANSIQEIKFMGDRFIQRPTWIVGQHYQVDEDKKLFILSEEKWAERKTLGCPKKIKY